jgi:hypothetical protein
MNQTCPETVTVSLSYSYEFVSSKSQFLGMFDSFLLLLSTQETQSFTPTQLFLLLATFPGKSTIAQSELKPTVFVGISCTANFHHSHMVKYI